MQGALNTFVVCPKKSMYLDTHVVDSTCADVKLIITACNLPLHKNASTDKLYTGKCCKLGIICYMLQLLLLLRMLLAFAS